MIISAAIPANLRPRNQIDLFSYTAAEIGVCFNRILHFEDLEHPRPWIEKILELINYVSKTGRTHISHMNLPVI